MADIVARLADSSDLQKARPVFGIVPSAGVGLIFLTFMSAVMLARLLGFGAAHAGPIATALQVLALFAFIIAFPFCRGLTLWVSIALTALGISLAAVEGHWTDWLSGTTALAPVLAIVTLAQLLSEPIEIGGYQREMVGLLQSHARWRNARLHVALLASFLFTCVAAGGALAATYKVLVRPEDGRETREAVMRAAMRGAGAAIGLTPITGTFGVTVTLTGIPAPMLVLYALPAAAVTLVLGAVACTIERTQELPPEGTRPVDHWRLAELALAVLSLLTGIGLFSAFLDIGPIDAIVLSILVAGLLWLLLLSPGEFWGHLRNFPKRIVRSTAPSIALFVPAGALAIVVSHNQGVEALFGEFLSTVPQDLAAYAVGGSIWLLFHVGIHPAVAVAIVGPVTMSTGLVSPGAMAFLAMASGGTAVVSSPFGGLTNLAAAISGRSAFDVGVRANLVFSLASLTVSIALASMFLS